MQDMFEEWRERAEQRYVRLFQSLLSSESHDWMHELRDHELVVRNLSEMLPFLPTPQTCAWDAGIELAKFNASSRRHIAPRNIDECRKWVVELWERVWQECGTNGVKMGEYLESWQDEALQLWKKAGWVT